MGLPRFHLTWGLAAALLASGLTLASCGGSSNTKKPTDTDASHQSSQFGPLAAQGPDVLGTGKPVQPGQPDTSWSIVIISAVGDTMEQDAQKALEKVRTVGGLPQAYMERRGESLVVAYGKYPAADAPQAQQDLKRIQGLKINGETPFAGAVLAPPPFDSLPGSIPEYDLSTLKQRRGKAAMYTLQVGAYARMDGQDPTPQDLASFRSAAEKAVVELRREGEEAFYHHGRIMSVVTVGVFGDKDVNPVVAGQDSMAVTMARKRHPLNLVNGQGVKVRMRGQAEAQLQPSRIIVIPN
jgi:hypothetical protein